MFILESKRDSNNTDTSRKMINMTSMLAKYTKSFQNVSYSQSLQKKKTANQYPLQQQKDP